ncbi:disintegrin and metalloproteinase domain-containing protein 21-like [Arvicola amphibius]|uniref:disintegrin and metalloproteinase domain-containing protein 21-like n=1 Tax=Arvicola amphibius TaxID=1047088 RepID=UPI0018E3971D|nr:disintegrin and metalloproteinase domain-containing protein 21-like [Arvicola amphibius]
MLSLSWGMRLVERPVIPRAPLLLVALWLLLLVPSQCFQGPPTWRYISSEVVIPRKEIYHGRGFQAPGRLSYSLRFRGQRHIIHLRRKTLIWPRHLLLTTQDDQGALQTDYPHFPVDCYYIGYLEGIPQSMVTLDSCYGGLDGVMMLDDLAYEIKPLNDSHMFEHIISQVVADSEAVGPMNEWKRMEHSTGPSLSRANSNVAPRMSSRDYASHPAAIKGHMLASYSVNYVTQNVTRTAHYLFSLASLMDSYMKNIHLRYYVFLFTVFNVWDPVTIRPGTQKCGDFHRYYQDNFYRNFRPDDANFINQHGPSDVNGAPILRSVCTQDCIGCIGKNDRYYVFVSVVLSNRVGRKLGLHFDNETYCYCQRRATCIMFMKPQLTDAFSNCSLGELNQILSTPGELTCLFYDYHTYYNRSISYDFCGNYKIDAGEQCDCGSMKECYANSCCKQNCKFTAGSICDKESCCANCTYSPSGTLCRSIQNICDLPEYCNGSKLTCPTDFYLQDGTPCSEEGYCYKGNCTDRNVHCKEVFGVSARAGNKRCYDINKESYRFGHCHRRQESLVFRACADKDKMCGRLQCTNVTHLPNLQEHVSFHQSIISGFSCFGLDEHRATESTDVGSVRYGTPCSQTNFCDRGSCNGSLTELDYDCTPEKCNFRGVCNNHRNCHCHVGWDPPNCVGHGPGGSLDSGPPPLKMRTITQTQQTVVYLRIIFGRIYVFIGSLLFGVAFRVAMIKIIKYEDLQAALIRGHGHGHTPGPSMPKQ